METITTKQLNKKTRHFEYIDYHYYTVEEATAQGLEWYSRPIPETIQPGEYILTDDNWVVPVMKVEFNTFVKKYTVRIPNGTFIIDKPHSFRKNEILAMKKMSITSNRSGQRHGTCLKNRLFAFALVTTNFDIAKSFQYAYCRIPDLKKRKDVLLLKQLIGSKEIIRDIMTKMEEMFNRSGVDPASIIGKVDRLFTTLVEKTETAEKSSDVIALSAESCRVANVLGNWAGFEGKEDEPIVAMQSMLFSRSNLMLPQANDKKVEQEEAIFDGDVE